jgi:hypothetical protein
MDAPDPEVVADAFDLLSDPIRVRILTTLWEEDRRGPTSYSDLQAGVGVRDSGRFNYHLSKLTDRYLRKTDDGYAMRPAGVHVVDLLASGVFGDVPERGPIDVETPCPRCDGGFELQYRDGETVVQCPDCELVACWLFFPPAGVRDRDDESLVWGAHVRSRGFNRMANAGLCPFCGREIERELVHPDERRVDRMHVTKRCDGCEARLASSLGSYLFDHPGVVAFLWDHGAPLDDRPYWKFDFVRDPQVELLDDDPLRYRQRIEREGERLEVDVGPGAEVVAIRRVRDRD